jgi:hypothetical protein
LKCFRVAIELFQVQKCEGSFKEDASTPGVGNRKALVARCGAAATT